jgi:hypothetical protein
MLHEQQSQIRKGRFVRWSRRALVVAAVFALSCGDDDDNGSSDGGANNNGGSTSGNNNGAMDGGNNNGSTGNTNGDNNGMDAAPGNDGDGSAGDRPMSFFVTSRGLGKGGNLGGLAGADAHCVALAKTVNAVKKQWRAYLSIEAGPIHARDRIGSGPWYNADGVLVATNVQTLHANMGMDNALNVDVSVDEAGELVPGRDEAKRPPGTMNDHDILTGSTVDGMVATGSTCMDWTSDAATGTVAQVGHSDKDGPNGRIQWNSSHATSGCAEGRMMGGIGSGGGSGRFYCFATD